MSFYDFYQKGLEACGPLAPKQQTGFEGGPQQLPLFDVGHQDLPGRAAVQQGGC